MSAEKKEVRSRAEVHAILERAVAALAALALQSRGKVTLTGSQLALMHDSLFEALEAMNDGPL